MPHLLPLCDYCQRAFDIIELIALRLIDIVMETAGFLFDFHQREGY